MITRLQQHISQQHLFTPRHRLLVALSGGVDSVVLCYALCELGYTPILAHCNFGLRGKDSDGDEIFCRQLAKTLGLTIHVKTFATKVYAAKHGLSIQMAARELRYTWFDDLLRSQGYDFLLTAHHANDSVESILLNLVRGTGSKGLLGIASTRKQIIRPLLHFQKSELLHYAKQGRLNFREDKSNAEDKYKRNLVRLKVMPLLKKINPDVEQAILKNANLLAQTEELADAYVAHKTESLCIYRGDTLVISVKALMAEKYSPQITGKLMHAYGFNSTHIQKLLQTLSSPATSGKSFRSKTHVCEISFGEILIRKIQHKTFVALKFGNVAELCECAKFRITHVKAIKKLEPTDLVLNTDVLTFPLTLRPVKKGDRFKPFGMKGFKLLSDFFREQKVSVLQRKEAQVLCDGNGQIIWVCGYRSDERFRITEAPAKMIKLTYLGD